MAGLYLIGAGRHAVAARLRPRQRILRPCHRAAQLSLARALQAAHAPRSARSCCTGALPAAFAGTSASCATVRSSGRSLSCPARSNMSPQPGQSRAPPFQVCAVSPAGRRSRSLFRHGHAELLRWDQHPAGRRVRDQLPALRSPLAQSHRQARSTGSPGRRQGALTLETSSWARGRAAKRRCVAQPMCRKAAGALLGPSGRPHP